MEEGTLGKGSQILSRARLSLRSSQRLASCMLLQNAETGQEEGSMRGGGAGAGRSLSGKSAYVEDTGSRL